MNKYILSVYNDDEQVLEFKEKSILEIFEILKDITISTLLYEIKRDDPFEIIQDKDTLERTLWTCKDYLDEKFGE